MCGIVGVITKQKNGFSQGEIGLLSQLLYADALRGHDGTGIFFNTKKNKPNIKTIKQASSAGWFLYQKEYQKAKDTFFSESNFVIGHNRSATKGKINQECTHPFREQHITLVHNGTLATHKELNEASEVDSHAICVSMATKGEEETLKEIDGAFALVWFNAKTKKLNLCRNYQRPLFLVETYQSFLLSSELELAQWILKRNNQTIKSTEEIKPKTLYSFDLDDMSKFDKKEIEFKSWEMKPQTFDYYHGYSSYKKPTPNYKTNTPVSTYVNIRNLKIGDMIKFKTGPVRRNGKGGTFLEGDILKWQQNNESFEVVTTDFRDEWELRIFGKENELLPFAVEKKIKGKISQIIVGENNKTVYIITEHCKYGEIKDITEGVFSIGAKYLALIKKDNNKKPCMLCDAEYIGEKTYQKEPVCDTCWEQMQSGVQYMY